AGHAAACYSCVFQGPRSGPPPSTAHRVFRIVGSGSRPLAFSGLRGSTMAWKPRTQTTTGLLSYPKSLLPRFEEHMMTRSFWLTWALLALSGATGTPAFADDITFEAGIEFAKPGGESLQLNLARPKTQSGKTPAIL